jgi:hypothetical protein
MKFMIDYFDTYTDGYKWKVIPIFSRSKIPVTKKWNGKYNREWSRSYVSANPMCNIGLLLGDIVDVEGDTPEANALLIDMLKGHDHPTYQSSKSVHHLFKSPDHKLTCLKFGGVEFRGHKHYSVIPPSIHAWGIDYKWLVTPECGIPEMPQALRELYENNKKKCYKLKPEFTSQNCKSCGKNQVIHDKRLKLELKAFQLHGCQWTCRNCRKIDVRETCRMMRRGKI